MYLRFRVLVYSIAVSLLFAGFGCAEESPPPDEAEQLQQASSIVDKPYEYVGFGLDPTSEDEKHVCLPDYDISVDPSVQEANVYGSMVSEKSEIEQSVEASLGVDGIPISDVAIADI